MAKFPYSKEISLQVEALIITIIMKVETERRSSSYVSQGRSSSLVSQGRSSSLVSQGKCSSLVSRSLNTGSDGSLITAP